MLRILGAAMLVLIMVSLFSRAKSQEVKLHLPEPQHWQFNVTKLTGYGCFALAGWAHGWEDAYYADPHVFERAWNVGPYSFPGSEAWQRNYKYNRYRNENGFINPHKFQGFNTFRDIKHMLGFVQSRSLMLGGVIVFSAKNQNWKHRLLDLVIGSAAYSIAAQQAYNIRYR